MAENNQSGTALWQDAHVLELRAAMGAGCSYTQAAARINSRFGTSYSRNAAIGKASRLGDIVIKMRAPVPRKPRTYKPRLRIIAANGNSNQKRVIQISELDLPALRCIEVEPRNISLTDLEPNDCRYPYGESPYLFCGHPKMAGKSYCGPHHALSMKPLHGLTGRESERFSALIRRRNIPAATLIAQEAV